MFLIKKILKDLQNLDSKDSITQKKDILLTLGMTSDNADSNQNIDSNQTAETTQNTDSNKNIESIKTAESNKNTESNQIIKTNKNIESSKKDASLPLSMTSDKAESTQSPDSKENTESKTYRLNPIVTIGKDSNLKTYQSGSVIKLKRYRI